MFQTEEINTRGYRGRGYLKRVSLANGEVSILLDLDPTAIPRVWACGILRNGGRLRC